MRQYRAWDKSYQRYLPENFIHQLSLRQDGRVMWLAHDGLTDVTDKFDIELSTGLKDKNGREYCFNDIGKHAKGVKFKVYWSDNDGQWCIEFLGDAYETYGVEPLWKYAQVSEIIGTIHDKEVTT